MTGNPFISAYVQSDLFGKGLFWALFALSIVSWVVIIHRVWLFVHMQRLADEIKALFSEKDPLSLSRPVMIKRVIEVPHPFFEVYKGFKESALKLMQRNQHFITGSKAFLSEADLKMVESQVHAKVLSEAKKLDRSLFVLSTTVTLAPFLGLLGTVWGILVTFSQLHQHAVNNTVVLSGLSLALTTTVAGLLIAIPALVGHSILKSLGKEYRREMMDFSNELLAALELRYRRVDETTAIPS